jgi:hypothetical protein
MTKTTYFVTKDNEKFEKLVDAQLHEAKLDLTSALINRGVVNDGNLREACHQLVKNYSTFEPLLAKLKALNLKKKKSEKSV